MIIWEILIICGLGLALGEANTRQQRRKRFNLLLRIILFGLMVAFSLLATFEFIEWLEYLEAVGGKK